MKITSITIEATPEDLKASRTLGNLFNDVLCGIFAPLAARYTDEDEEAADETEGEEGGSDG